MRYRIADNNLKVLEGASGSLRQIMGHVMITRYHYTNREWRRLELSNRSMHPWQPTDLHPLMPAGEPDFALTSWYAGWGDGILLKYRDPGRLRLITRGSGDREIAVEGRYELILIGNYDFYLLRPNSRSHNALFKLDINRPAGSM